MVSCERPAGSARPHASILARTGTLCMSYAAQECEGQGRSLGCTAALDTQGRLAPWRPLRAALSCTIHFGVRRTHAPATMRSRTVAQSVKTVGIIGGGLMGSGIAQTCAQAGYKVLMAEVNQELLDRGVQRVTGAWKMLSGKGRITEEQATEYA